MVSFFIGFFFFQLAVGNRVGDKTLLILEDNSVLGHLSEVGWCTVSQLELFYVLLC